METRYLRCVSNLRYDGLDENVQWIFYATLCNQGLCLRKLSQRIDVCIQKTIAIAVLKFKLLHQRSCTYAGVADLGLSIGWPKQVNTEASVILTEPKNTKSILLVDEIKGNLLFGQFFSMLFYFYAATIWGKICFFS